jgi:DNA polymerase I
MTNLIIDGNSLMHRVHWVSKSRPMLTQSGREVGDILIFLRTLKSYINQYSPNAIYCCWDKKLLYPSENFRDELTYSEYKDNRDREVTKDVFNNTDDLMIMLEALGIKNMFPRTLEADDVIAWLTHNLTGKNIVLTADNDMLQLVNENTFVFNTNKKQLYTQLNFKNLVGVPISSFVLYKAIKGDSSDNIKGIDGYGEVKSKKIANEFIENKNALDVFTESQKQHLLRNIKLMNLSVGYLYAGEDEVTAYQKQLSRMLEPDFAIFEKYCKEFELNDILRKLDDWADLFSRSRIINLLESLSDS